MKLERLLGLLCILACTDKITDRFEVSRRTIFRDLDTLNCAGIPIVSYPGVGGGVAYEILEEHFQLHPIAAIEFENSYGAELFSPKNQADLFEVVLEYDTSDEFDLTNKIDAAFFHRSIEGQTAWGQIRFQVSNLEWAADLVLGLQDKFYCC